MAMCAKCMGRPETMVRSCRRYTSLKSCQRDESATNQNVCNLCMDDQVGNMLPKDDKPCSLFRGTCPGAVEKRIRGIVPPNLDIVGTTRVGGLRYCAPTSAYTTSTHYYREEHIMQTGQACIDHVPRFTGWDWSRLRDSPYTVKNELGLACANPDDEDTCPKARRCADENVCHTDEPDWSQDEILQRPYPWGWGEEAKPYLDPREEHDYPGLPEGYTYHLEAATWAVVPRAEANFLDQPERP